MTTTHQPETASAQPAVAEETDPLTATPKAASDAEQSDIAAFIHETGHLKNTPRYGWFYLGIKQPETVAEHSHRTAVIAYLLAAQEGANPDRAATLALFHDLAETRTGDLATPARHYLGTPNEQAITQDQAQQLPQPARNKFLQLTAEYAKQETIESQLAHDADKIECLTQALEYQNQGTPNTQTWITNSLEAIHTNAGHNLAANLIATTDANWWKPTMTPTRQRPTHRERATDPGLQAPGAR